MNAVFYTISTPAERGIIDSICLLLAQRNFEKAEEVLIDFMSDVLSEEYNTQDDAEKHLSTIKTIYLKFNEYYLNWIQEQGKLKEEELKALKNDAHDNLLFAHMSDPESMDDAVYALAEYLTNFESDDQLEEASYQLSCYKHQ